MSLKRLYRAKLHLSCVAVEFFLSQSSSSVELMYVCIPFCLAFAVTRCTICLELQQYSSETKQLVFVAVFGFSAWI